ncbi:site-specific DNA-methyltransferase, partial [Ruegeria sp. 2012CJ41-6]
RCFSKAGDLVLDPFSGSGSTSVAAVLNDRAFIGIELEEAHCDTARSRVTGAQAYKARQSNQTQGLAA